MRKIVASMLMAMDGVVENPHLWTVQFRSEESQQYKFDELFASDALLLGRRTYQDFAVGWPGVTGAYGERINTMPKYVPTTTLQEAQWNATLIKDDVGAEVTRLKQEPGQDILIFGSVELIHRNRRRRPLSLKQGRNAAFLVHPSLSFDTPLNS